MKHTIDAQGKKLGRVASQAAVLLMGKTTPDFQKHSTSSNTVEVVNASELVLPREKREQKIYKRYSGYPGGLKEERMEEIISKKGYAEIVRKAVYGMLPANRLRKKLMLQLEVRE